MTPGSTERQAFRRFLAYETYLRVSEIFTASRHPPVAQVGPSVATVPIFQAGLRDRAAVGGAPAPGASGPPLGGMSRFQALHGV